MVIIGVLKGIGLWYLHRLLARTKGHHSLRNILFFQDRPFRGGRSLGISVSCHWLEVRRNGRIVNEFLLMALNESTKLLTTDFVNQKSENLQKGEPGCYPYFRFATRGLFIWMDEGRLGGGELVLCHAH